MAGVTVRNRIIQALPAACRAVAKADGVPGPNTCRLVQFAVLEPSQINLGERAERAARRLTHGSVRTARSVSRGSCRENLDET